MRTPQPQTHHPPGTCRIHTNPPQTNQMVVTNKLSVGVSSPAQWRTPLVGEHVGQQGEERGFQPDAPNRSFPPHRHDLHPDGHTHRRYTMAHRVCSTPGCPTLIPSGTRGGRCDTHRRAADKARGSREARGYGADHRRLRAAIVARIDAGQIVRCIHCGVRLTAETLHLDHSDDRKTYRGASCSFCNQSIAGKKSHEQLF